MRWPPNSTRSTTAVGGCSGTSAPGSPPPPSRVPHPLQSCSPVSTPAGTGPLDATNRQATSAPAWCREGPRDKGCRPDPGHPPRQPLDFNKEGPAFLPRGPHPRPSSPVVSTHEATGRLGPLKLQADPARGAYTSTGAARGPIARAEATASAPRPQALSISLIQGGRPVAAGALSHAPLLLLCITYSATYTAGLNIGPLRCLRYCRPSARPIRDSALLSGGAAGSPDLHHHLDCGLSRVIAGAGHRHSLLRGSSGVSSGQGARRNCQMCATG
ncbi:hypothetical protein NDU88_004264 [Pleurodeles waltl]|uniref:Uncharacterized protein n=1 Tax=Pleurodeles waltl TaxID=8319 RepID=A0AAV7VIT5_PLEWA|nr:hypothetical protein NDU88_004264 [Pleurodeles waltl]